MGDATLALATAQRTAQTTEALQIAASRAMAPAEAAVEVARAAAAVSGLSPEAQQVAQAALRAALVHAEEVRQAISLAFDTAQRAVGRVEAASWALDVAQSAFNAVQSGGWVFLKGWRIRPLTVTMTCCVLAFVRCTACDMDHDGACDPEDCNDEDPTVLSC